MTDGIDRIQRALEAASQARGESVLWGQIPANQEQTPPRGSS
jgi:hypothetical protein